MKNLLMKEMRLALHPTAYMFIVLSFMLLIPNYPYYVLFFYTGLAFFFTCLSGRENRDIFYTMLLPVKKTDVVKARILLLVILQAIQTVICIPAAFLRSLMNMPNEAGMDANIAFFGISFIVMGIFNFVFFLIYYKDVSKVGKAFAITSVFVFLFIIIETVLEFAVPFMRDCLDTPDPQFITEKLIVLAIGIAFYVIATVGIYNISKKNFMVQDL